VLKMDISSIAHSFQIFATGPEDFCRTHVLSHDLVLDHNRVLNLSLDLKNYREVGENLQERMPLITTSQPGSPFSNLLHPCQVRQFRRFTLEIIARG